MHYIMIIAIIHRVVGHYKEAECKEAENEGSRRTVNKKSGEWGVNATVDVALTLR